MNNQKNSAVVAERLIRNVKIQVKKLMEEAVVRNYVHEESEVVTTLCASIESILRYGLKHSIFIWIEDETTFNLCRKIAKVCPEAQHTLDRLVYHQKTLERRKQDSARRPMSLNAERSPLGMFQFNLSGSHNDQRRQSLLQPNLNTPNFSLKNNDPLLLNFWIRVALLEKDLDKIVSFLTKNASLYYEPYSVIADPCNGPLLADLLRGPCTIDYSRTRTTDHLLTDPPVSELIQRHGIYGSLMSRELSYVPPLSEIGLSNGIKYDKTEELEESNLERFDESPSSMKKLDNFRSSHYSKYKFKNSVHKSHETLSSRSTRHTNMYASLNRLNSTASPTELKLFQPITRTKSKRVLATAAKDHVESMHQSLRSTLLFGKNNVLTQPPNSSSLIPGYLSLHDCGRETGITLRWTPNQAVLAPKSTIDSTDSLADSIMDTIDFTSSSDTPVSHEQDAFWGYAMEIRFRDVAYAHTHQLDSQFHLILISADGTQFPPFTFSVLSHLSSFFGSLEHGLETYGGLLDPPVIPKNIPESNNVKFGLSNMDLFKLPLLFGSDNRNSTMSNSHPPSINSPKLKSRHTFHTLNRPTTVQSVNRPEPIDKANNLDDHRDSDTLSMHHVFRIAIPDQNMDSKLSDLATSVSTPVSNSSTANGESCRRSDSTHSIDSSYSPLVGPYNSKVNIQMSIGTDAITNVCTNLRNRLLFRAFRKWYNFCQKIRAIRSRLSNIVTPSVITVDSPTNAKEGVTIRLWNRLISHPDPKFTLKELCRHIYFGNCDPEIRQEVWPYLLGLYPWNANPHEVEAIQQNHRELYYQALYQWNKVARWIEQDDKYSGLITLPHCKEYENPFTNNGFSPIELDCENSNPLLHENMSDLTEGMSDRCVNQLQSNGSSHNGTDHHVSEISINDSFDLNGTSRSQSNVIFTSARDDYTNQNNRFLSADHPIPRPEFSLIVLDNFADNLYRIDKDVSRCDRNHSFFSNTHSRPVSSANDSNELNLNLFKLRNIICTWVWLHLEFGYVQGMCDLLAPLLVVIEDEALTYACFSCLMDWMKPYFPKAPQPSSPPDSPDSHDRKVDESCVKTDTQVPIRKTLLELCRQSRNSLNHSKSPNRLSDNNLVKPFCPVIPKYDEDKIESPYLTAIDPPTSISCMDMRFSLLKALINVFDPELGVHLSQKCREEQLFFCYRWLLLDFKRELKYEDVFAVWEIIWASRNLVSYDFGLFLALAMIQYYRDIILYYNMDMTEIMRFFNELTERHDAKVILELARSFVFQIQTLIAPG